MVLPSYDVINAHGVIIDDHSVVVSRHAVAFDHDNIFQCFASNFDSAVNNIVKSKGYPFWYLVDYRRALSVGFALIKKLLCVFMVDFQPF